MESEAAHDPDDLGRPRLRPSLMRRVLDRAAAWRRRRDQDQDQDQDQDGSGAGLAESLTREGEPKEGPPPASEEPTEVIDLTGSEEPTEVIDLTVSDDDEEAVEEPPPVSSAAGRAAPATPARKRRPKASSWHESCITTKKSRKSRNLPHKSQTHAPIDIGRPEAPPFWRIRPSVDDAAAVEKAALQLAAWRDEAAAAGAAEAAPPGGAKRRRRGRTYGRPIAGAMILYGWNAVSGADYGWFPSAVVRPARDVNDAALNFEIYSGPRGTMGPAFSERSVGAINGAVDVALKPEEYGTKWVILEDRRPPRGDAFLAARFRPDGSVPDALLGDDAFEALVLRCGGHEPSFTLNLGFVSRGENDGVGVETAAWPNLLRLVFAYFAKGRAAGRDAGEEDDWRCTSVYVNFADPDPRTRDDHLDKANVGPSYLCALGDFQGGGLRVPGRSPEPFDVRPAANRARGGAPFFKFHAAAELHGVVPFQGKRVSISLYAKKTHTLDAAAKARLAAFGFRLLPDDDPARRP